MDNFRKLKLPFDEVWCINLLEREDKYRTMCTQFVHLGILDTVKFYRDVKYPFSDKIARFLWSNNFSDVKTGGAFNLTRNNYKLIKSAYLRGVNSIMIIEDDCLFYKDVNILQLYFDNLPYDYDVLQINCLRGRYEELHFEKPENVNKLWDLSCIKTYGTGCYALSRNGMKKIITFLDNKFTAIDTPLYDNNTNWKIYIPNRPLGLCIPESESDIQGVLSEHHYYYKDIKNIDLSMYQYE